MVILKNYQLALTLAGFRGDPHQLNTVKELQELYEQIITVQKDNASRPRILSRILRSRSTEQLKGCYLWGGVGRGKTWLMDMFFQSVPTEQKRRFHFYQFMQFVHTELAKLKDQRDPLKIVAAQIAQQCRILCIDEFHVDDITDAMLLYGLLEALFAQHIVLVATSNQEPEELYKNGLQRSRFLPAIDLIKSNTNVVNLEGDTDYRHMVEMVSERYITPIDGQTLQTMKELFKKYNEGESLTEQVIQINKRPINTLLLGEGMVWFDFEALCGSARAAIDYIEIARKYSMVMLSNVPVLTDDQDDKARRFVNLIDELYDKKTHVIIAAVVEPHKLYNGKRLIFEFTRTVSRLIEMRSCSYTAQCLE